MPDDQEISVLLKQILSRLDKLETMQAENVTIQSGPVYLETGANNPVEIRNTSEVLVTMGDSGSVNIEEVDGHVAVTTAEGRYSEKKQK